MFWGEKGARRAAVAPSTRNGDAEPSDTRDENGPIDFRLRRANIAFFRVVTTYFFSLPATFTC